MTARIACIGFAGHRSTELQQQLADSCRLQLYNDAHSLEGRKGPPDGEDALLVGPDVDDALAVANSLHGRFTELPVFIVRQREAIDKLIAAVQVHPTLGRCTQVIPWEMLARVPELLGDLRQRQVARQRHANLVRNINRQLAAAPTPAPDRSAYLDQLLDHAPIGVVMVSGEGRITAANRRAKLYFPLNGHEGRSGVTLEDLFSPDEVSQLQDLIATALQQRSGPHNLQITYRGNGDEHVFSVIAAPVEQMGDRDAAMLIFQDVSDLVRLQQDHERARAEAEQANLSKSRLLAGVSHELRTPMNAISGFSEIMANELLGPMADDRYLEYVRLVFDSARHLTALIDDLLDYSKIEAGILHLSVETVDFCELARDTLQLVQKDARARGQTITANLPADDILLRVDRRMSRQVLINLLTNAIKFTPNGGVIELGLRRDADGVLLSVDDSGPGIAADDIDKVLKPFERGLSAASPFVEGTGIGLFLVNRIVSLHAGKLQISPSELGGTRVSVVLPPQRVQDTGSS